MGLLPELFAEILKELNHPSDRNDLLSFSLVNSVWRAESQRVLFRRMYDSLPQERDLRGDHSLMWSKREAVMGRHAHFLQSVIASPRLASYVELYAQDGLAAQHAGNEDSGTSLNEYNKLWSLTSRALPLLINLKHLHFSYNTKGEAPQFPQDILSGCTFQLKSLHFICGHSYQEHSTDNLHPVVAFIGTQTSLQHLALAQHAGRFSRDVPQGCVLDESWLPADIYQSIICVPSFSCNILSIPYLARHHIRPTALDLGPPPPRPSELKLHERHLVVLEQVRFLSIRSFERLCNTLPCRGALDALVLLEIQIWSLHTLQRLDEYALPSLRVISFLEYTTSNSRVSPEECRKVAERSFLCFPKLHYVMVQDNPRRDLSRRTKLSRKYYPGTEECGIEAQIVHLYQHYGAVWWQRYDMTYYTI